MHKRLILLTIYAVAMAYLESAVVVYLRAVYYQEGFGFPLAKGGPMFWAQTIGLDTVVAGLEVLPAMGVQARRDEEGEILFERCAVVDVSEGADKLRILLDEARAFRKAFRTTQDAASFFAGGQSSYDSTGS